MSFLTTIEVSFPRTADPFYTELLRFLKKLGTIKQRFFAVRSSSSAFIPRLLITESPLNRPQVRFSMDDGESVEVSVENNTGADKVSEYQYSAISCAELSARMKQAELVSIDHLGFNLPWFEKGIHPNILNIRNLLREKCLYHTFPNGEPWDFILPGTKAEVSGKKPVNYRLVRKPKFELVSFSNCSIPLVQIDVGTTLSYTKLVKLFPEGIHESEAKSVWVYLENPFGIDVCLVFNKAKKTDWSILFRDSRLVAEE